MISADVANFRRRARSEEDEKQQKERRRYHDTRYREEHRELLRLKATQYRCALAHGPTYAN